MINPFTTEYLEQEIEFYDPTPYDKNDVKLVLKPIQGVTRFDEYLNVNIRSEGPEIPILFFDGQIWMSLTWMEVQSFWVALQEAKGRVLTGGLGMGYAALRFAAKPEVEKVVVYEIDQRVIDFFQDTKAGRPEMDKIEVIHGDLHDAVGEFDFAFVDIYATLLPDELRDDAQYFVHDTPEGLKVKKWCFWGQEAVWYDLLLKGYGPNINCTEIEFYHWHEESEGSELKCPGGMGDADYNIDVHDLLRGDLL